MAFLVENMLESYERKNVFHFGIMVKMMKKLRKIKISMFVHSMLILESRWNIIVMAMW